MKRPWLALPLTLCLFLCGCSSLLESSYLSVTPHSYLFLTPQDDSTTQVSTYQELVGAITNMVSQGQREAVIQLTNYIRDADEDLSTACLEVQQRDPLGAYAIESIQYELVPILTYQQSTVTITYRRTTAQIQSVIPVTGSYAIRTQIETALSSFQSELVLQVTYFNQNEDYVQSLIQQAYLDTPSSAFGLPETEVHIYPDSGLTRVIELVFTYSDTTEALEAKQQELLSAAEALASNAIDLDFKERLLCAALYDDLSTHLLAMEEEELEEAVEEADSQPYSSSPYATLVSGQPDSQAIALAYQLLCELAGAPCQVVVGTLDDQPYYWNIVTVDDESRHVDLNLGREGFYRTDASYEAISGAVWDRSLYPQCGTPVEEPEPTDTESFSTDEKTTENFVNFP